MAARYDRCSSAHTHAVSFQTGSQSETCFLAASSAIAVVHDRIPEYRQDASVNHWKSQHGVIGIFVFFSYHAYTLAEEVRTHVSLR